MVAEVEGVPDDYPGRVVTFPDDVSHLVFGMYGVQSPHADIREIFIAELASLCDAEGGPGRVEHCRFVDNNGIACDMLLTYGVDRAAHDAWWQSAPLQKWWQSKAQDMQPEAGYWREVLNTDKDRFNYAAGVEDKVGSAAVLPLKPSNTFGYWGSYRDRLPASVQDSFESEFTEVPPILSHKTKGRRLKVAIPDNLCLIREGQAWGNCGAEEKAVWDEQMAAVVDEWVGFLGSDPQVTGCLSVRQCNELDVQTGKPQPKQCQIAFLLSLGHIEHAARTHVAHLAVHKAFVRMYREPAFDPKMHVWVEVHILKKDDLETEYVNCHEKTGLMPFFEVIEVGG
ncbi:MAG: phenylacetaldoxime dehydratase family protein [Gammaproteobacteria bacterium]